MDRKPRPREKMPTGKPKNSTQPEHGNFQAETMTTVHKRMRKLKISN